MGLGSEVDPVALSRELHNALDFTRSFFAGYGWNRLDGDFEEAKCAIEL